MSDGEDDFMCEEEEDYGLVSFIYFFSFIYKLILWSKDIILFKIVRLYESLLNV